MRTKIALITGGSRGLGKSAVLALADHGTDVIFTYNSKKDEADKVIAEVQAKGRKAVALQLDVSDARSFEEFVRQVHAALEKNWAGHKIDHLINNAGIGINVPFTETTEDQLDMLYKIHVKGPYLLTQKILPLMNDGGRIINVSTGLTRFSMPGYSAYATMKGAVEVLTRYMAKELGARKISVNTLAPGAIETDFGGGKVRDNADINHALASQTALGRVGLPEDIGGVICSLLMKESHWITAQRIEASGGMFI